MIGIQGILISLFYTWIFITGMFSCPTDPSVISSSVATTNMPTGNHFEWPDYSVYFCVENDSTFAS